MVLYDAKLKENSLIKKIYKSKSIQERHRHRYEVNISYKDKFEKNGMIFSGLSPDNKLPEIIEIKNHPWFVLYNFIQNLNLDLWLHILYSLHLSRLLKIINEKYKSKLWKYRNFK